MAKSSPCFATQDWLSRATAKLERSIFRRVEHKYKSQLKKYEDTIKANDILIKHLSGKQLEGFDVMEEHLYRKIVECDALKARIEEFTKPVVAMKNVVQEVFLVKPMSPNTSLEEGMKRKLDYDKECEEIVNLRDAPPNKILKISPVPRTIPLPNKSSPKPKKKLLKRERSKSPPVQPVPLAPSVFATLAPSNPVVSGSPVVSSAPSEKKRKKKKEDLIVRFYFFVFHVAHFTIFSSLTTIDFKWIFSSESPYYWEAPAS